MIHNGTENHFFTVNGSLFFFFLRACKKISHGSPSNINQHTLSESHAKFGAFIRPVTVNIKPPDYYAQTKMMRTKPPPFFYTHLDWTTGPNGSIHGNLLVCDFS